MKKRKMGGGGERWEVFCDAGISRILGRGESPELGLSNPNALKCPAVLCT